MLLNINGLIFRVTIGTWNVAGILPCNDLEIEGWLCTEEPSDIYIIGLVCFIYFTVMLSCYVPHR